MTRKLVKDKILANGELESESFLARLNATTATTQDVSLARQQYGYDLPDDVIELIARQQAVARPIIEQYHILHESTPTLAMARASMQRDLDGVTDILIGMDLDDLGDIGDWEDEYSCPQCAHRWSGAPNYRTGHGGVVYVPTGRISRRTGRTSAERIGPPPSNKGRNFKYGRRWKGASAEKLPRGFGNKPIQPGVTSGTWRKKAKPPKVEG